MKTRILISICLAFIFNTTTAQNTFNHYFGKIEGYDFKEGSKVIVQFYDTKQIRRHDIPDSIYTAPLSENGEFKVSFPTQDNIFYISFEFLSGEKKIIELTKLLGSNPFLSERLDSVKIRVNVNEKTFHFTGNGSDKFNCQVLLNHVIMPTQLRDLEFTKVLDSQKAILRKFKDKLSENIYNQLLADLTLYLKYQFVYSNYARYRATSNVEIKTDIEDFFNSKVQEDSFRADKQNFSSARVYADFILNLQNLKYHMTEGKKKEPIPYFEWMYNNILSNYSGLLKERLIITFITSTSQRYMNNQMKILDAAINMMSDQSNRRFLIEYMNKQIPGVNAHPFSFQDLIGKTHNLKDYKDKIIVMDFWFIGCHGCTQIPPVMRVIMENFKQRTDVVFISVNVDYTREKWTKGLATELYTCPGQIHLKTIDGGSSDPFIRYYNFNSYPQLVIIGKNGILLSANPPDPRLDKGNGIVKMIQTIK